MTQLPEDPHETESWEEKKRRSARARHPAVGPDSAVPTDSTAETGAGPSTMASPIRSVGQRPEDPAETARWEKLKPGREATDATTERKRFWPFGRRNRG